MLLCENIIVAQFLWDVQNPYRVKDKMSWRYFVILNGFTRMVGICAIPDNIQGQM